MSAATDAVLKLAAALSSDPVEVVVVTVDDKTVAARIRATPAGTILYEGTGATTDDAVAALQKSMSDAAAQQVATLETQADALRTLLK